jgi:DNA-directed RNA polymerase subunit N (RpoN/RPB10)
MACKHCSRVVGQVYTINLSGCFTCGDRHSGIKMSAAYVGRVGRNHKYALVNPVRCSRCGKWIGYSLAVCEGESKESAKRPKRTRRPSLAEQLFSAKVKERENVDV